MLMANITDPYTNEAIRLTELADDYKWGVVARMKIATDLFNCREDIFVCACGKK